MHYRADGGLDMRYSSSKAAVSSGNYGGGGGGGGFGGGGSSSRSSCRSSTSGSSSNYSSGVHLTKSGAPDKRFSENRTYGFNSSGAPDLRCTAHLSKPSSPKVSAPSMSSGVHLTRAGEPDRRYAENRVVGKNVDGSNDMRYTAKVSRPSRPTEQDPKSGVHLTRSGAPDMRYAENRHPGKNMDGSTDMRYAAKVGRPSRPTEQDPKSGVHLTKSGEPDKRHTENRIPGKNADGSDDKRFTSTKSTKSKQADSKKKPDGRLTENRIPGKNLDGSPDLRFKINKPVSYISQQEQDQPEGCEEEMMPLPFIGEFYDLDSLMGQPDSLYENVDISNEPFQYYEEAEGKPYPKHSPNTADTIINLNQEETAEWDDSIFDEINDRINDDSNWNQKDFANIEIGLIDAVINSTLKKKRMKIISKKITTERLLEQWDAIQENGYPECYVDLCQRTLSQLLNTEGKSILEEDQEDDD